MILKGAHLVKFGSQTQPTVTLFSGEAELVGIVRAASHAMGLRGVCCDQGVGMGIHLVTDSSAAEAITRRRGVGKVRHLEVANLWVQEKLREGAFTLGRVAKILLIATG